MKQLISVFLLCLCFDVLAVDEISRIAFGSCAMQTVPQPIWKTIAEQDPDLFLFIGDAIYADYDGKDAHTPTEATLERDWGMLADEPNYRLFAGRVPVMATWDNHDYGSHDGGEGFALKQLTKDYFLDFFDDPENSDRRRSPGIYDARVVGPEGKRVQIIMFDTRWFKEDALMNSTRPAGLKGSLGKYLPHTNPDVSLLGEEQWRWLKQQLKQPAELRLIVSSTQVVADQKGMDEWGNYPLERQRLIELIRQVEDSAVMVLSGNVHFAELSQYVKHNWRLLDFTSSGLTHTNSEYADAENLYRIGKPYAGLNFGMLEVDWERKPAPIVRLMVTDEDGSTVLYYEVPMDKLNITSGKVAK